MATNQWLTIRHETNDEISLEASAMTTTVFTGPNGRSVLSVPDADTPFGGWWTPKLVGEDATRVIAGPFVSSRVQEAPDMADRTHVITAPVRAAVLHQRGYTLSRVVETFRELAVAQILTMGLLLLNTVLLGLFAAGTGWDTNSVRLLAGAEIAYLVVICVAHVDPALGHVPWLRKTVAVLTVLVGISFTLVGSGMGAMQYLYDAVHATGMI